MSFIYSALFSFLCLFSLLITPATIFAGGFEKAVQWSASSAAVGGAVGSSIEGAEALYFNPAGLSRSNGNEVSVSVTPTLARLQGPIQYNDQEVKSNPKLKTPFGILTNYKLSENTALGLGAYSAGGTESNYKNVAFKGFSMRPDVTSSLTVLELSAGIGHQFNKNFSVGAAWRATFIKADLASAEIIPLGSDAFALTSVAINDINASNYKGFRLGAQYVTDDKSAGFGVSYRSPVAFKGKTEKLSGRTEVSGGSFLSIKKGNGPVTIENSFPTQIALDAHKTITPELTLFSGYTWSQYSVNRSIKTGGNMESPLSPKPLAIPEIQQNWKDQHNFRVGLESRHLPDYKIRAGYVYTSAVTNENAARATFSSPGPAHSFLAGLGRDFFQGKLTADLTGEYSMAEGEGTTTNDVTGNFKSSVLAAYTSVKYRF